MSAWATHKYTALAFGSSHIWVQLPNGAPLMKETEIYLCFSCGAKNKLPRGRKLIAKCGKCGELLFSDTHGQNNAGYTSRTSGNSFDFRSAFKASAWIALIIVAYYLATYENSPSKRTSQRTETISRKGTDVQSSSQRSETLPPAVAIHSGVLWNRTGRPTEAPFEIITRPGANYFLKLVDYDTGMDAVAIYVVGGRRIEVLVPLGSYRLKYASGNVWRGEKHYFGPDDHTSFSQSNTRFDFRQEGEYINGYTVELIRQTGGNLPTRKIPRDQF